VTFSWDDLRQAAGRMIKSGRWTRESLNAHAAAILQEKEAEEEARREYWASRISRGEVLRLVAIAREEALRKFEKTKVHGSKRPVYWREGTVSGHPAMLRFGENDHPDRVDIFYGGTDGPMGYGHGHIIVKYGSIEEWLLPGPPGKRFSVFKKRFE